MGCRRNSPLVSPFFDQSRFSFIMQKGLCREAVILVALIVDDQWKWTTGTNTYIHASGYEYHNQAPVVVVRKRNRESIRKTSITAGKIGGKLQIGSMGAQMYS